MGRMAFRLISAGVGALIVLAVAEGLQSRVDKEDGGQLRRLLWLGHEALFGVLERPPVAFDHDGHTQALRDEECKLCHILEKTVEERELKVFQFPKEEVSEKSSSLMESYHMACMSCHKEKLKAGREAGPTTCGECHLEDRPETAPWNEMGYDYSIHHKHKHALESKCELCHHIYDEEQKELVYKKGAESSCRDCHGIRDEEDRRSFRNVAHAQCLDCHMKRDEEGLASGPFKCAGCHGERERMTVAEMTKLPRLFRDQKDQILLQIEGGRMKTTPFDHKAHEGRVRFCRDCHHRTQQACSTCHTLPGSPEGAGITLELAFHDTRSRLSCAGCHEAQKRATECMGCHLYDSKGATEQSCKICHSGTWEMPRPENLDRLIQELPDDKVPDKVEIKILEKEYEPALMPHKRILKTLIGVSKENRLADHFHGYSPAICLGCHHESPFDLEAKPPGCRSCHGVTRNSKALGRPGLMGAYHRKCMGCHEEMKVTALGCADCHKEKLTFALQASPSDLQGEEGERKR